MFTFTKSTILILHSMLTVSFIFSQAQKEVGDVGCPVSGFRLNNLCYTMSDFVVRAEMAERYCEIGGGQLVVVNSPDVHLFLQKLRIRKHLNYWVAKSNQEVCSSIRMSEDFIVTQSDCKQKYFYICEYAKINCTGIKKLPYTPYCFELSNDVETYAEAEKHCQFNGGQIANISTATARDYLKDMLYNDKRIFQMGLDQVNGIIVKKPDIQSFWTGIKYVGGKWIQSDNTVVNFTMWHNSQPDGTEKNENCVAVQNEWWDVSCDSGYAFPCQYQYKVSTKSSSDEFNQESVINPSVKMSFSPSNGGTVVVQNFWNIFKH